MSFETQPTETAYSNLTEKPGAGHSLAPNERPKTIDTRRAWEIDRDQTRGWVSDGHGGLVPEPVEQTTEADTGSEPVAVLDTGHSVSAAEEQTSGAMQATTTPSGPPPIAVPLVRVPASEEPVQETGPAPQAEAPSEESPFNP